MPDARPDLQHLLRLLGMLGDPNHRDGYWEPWRTALDGYWMTKIKTYVTHCSKPDVQPVVIGAFAGYVLAFFSADDDLSEEKLIESISHHISPHAQNQAATQFLADIRATAWRLMTATSRPTAGDVTRMWADVKL